MESVGIPSTRTCAYWTLLPSPIALDFGASMPTGPLGRAESQSLRSVDQTMHRIAGPDAIAIACALAGCSHVG
jgi:hypothetical protein